MALPNMRTLPEYRVLKPDNVTELTKLKKEAFYDWNYSLLPYANIECVFDQIAIESDEEAETIGQIEEQLNTYAEELLVDLILGRRSLDDMETYLGELEKLGLQDYINIKQARRDRYLANG